MTVTKGFLRIYTWYSDPSRISQYGALCPGCGVEHRFRVDAERYPDAWTFNGDFERPSFHPSMGSNLRGQYPELPRCHSFLENGRWRFLEDSSHKLAGRIVEMVPFPPTEFPPCP